MSFRPPATPRLWKRRIVLVAAAGLVVVAGLASRKWKSVLPGFLATYLPDCLWGAMVYLLLASILPRAKSINVAVCAAIVALCIELSQLYHAPWIDGLRRTTAGGLVLGFGFLWSDLACYAAGILAALTGDLWLVRSASTSAATDSL